MSVLDDPQSLRGRDPANMLGACGGLASDLRSGFRAGLAAGAQPRRADAVLVCGMGGSAVAGDVARVVAAGRFPMPVAVVRGADVPAWATKDTLVIVSSYSGDTAETNGAFEAALARGCRVVVVTSGGRIGTRAADLSLPRAGIPGGMQPRAALGHLAGAALGLLASTGAFPDVAGEVEEAAEVAAALAATLAPAAPSSVNPAKRLAETIDDRMPVIWGSDGLAGVAAYRWRTQWNENAKSPAFSSEMSELDHNEIVGWSEDRGRRFAIVALRVEGERDDLPTRFAFTADVARASGAIVEEVWATGDGPLARLLSLVTIGDHASTYSAILRGIDPTPVDVITRLKDTLR